MLANCNLDRFRDKIFVFSFPMFPMIADKNGGAATTENGIKTALAVKYVALFLKNVL